MANIAKLPLFCRCIIQNFPFIEEDFDALTNYELICKVVEYLNKVIASQNEVINLSNELQVAFEQLHDYVENYFDNLDVQEEINNKLDQMAEDGTLQEIITTYIQANVTWTFDTVADMKAATNLVDGSYARTLGFHEIGDGGASYYLITSDGTANEKDLIAIGDTLKARLLIHTKVYVEQLGAYGDKLHDDTGIIQYATSNYHYVVANKQYKTSAEISMLDNSVFDGENTGLIYAEPSELENKYIFHIITKDNVTIKNLNLESENLYSTLARPDHPNWNSSVSSNIIGIFFDRGCTNCKVKNISGKYLYNEVNMNSGTDYNKNENILIDGYKSRECVSSGFFFGYSKNITVKNIDFIASSLPLPGVHFMYVGHNGGENWSLENAKYVGNQYTIAALALAYANFIPGSITTDSPHILTIRNCDITGPRCVNMQNDKIVANFIDCKFTNMKRLASNNTTSWIGTICPAGTNNGYYRFFNCEFTKDASEETNMDDLTYYTDPNYTESYNDKLIFDNCRISGVDNLTYLNSLTKETILNNCIIDVERAIFRKSKYTGKYVANNCIINGTRAYILSSTGTTNTDNYIIKDCLIDTNTTAAIFNIDNANSKVRLYNNVINAPNRTAPYTAGSDASNVITNNTLINDTILS